MLVVFEGIDGSGKTTVSNRVAKRLAAAGHRVKHLRAEGKFASTVTESIRALGRDARNLALVPQAEFLLYVARDVQLLEEALRPALETHDIVIADRFFYTADALARFGRGLTRGRTQPVLEVATNGVEPSLVVLVDVDPKLARARRKAAKIAVPEAKAPSRKGLGGVGLQHRLRRGYLEMAADAPHLWAVLDNTNDLDTSIHRVTQLIETAHRDGVAAALAEFRRAGSVPPPEIEPRPASGGAVLSGTASATPERALTRLLDWVDARTETEPRVAAYLLSGLHGGPVDERRRRLMDRAPEGVLAALSGLDDEASWTLREALAEQYPDAAIKSLSSRMDATHERAAELRHRFADRAPEAVVRSLSGLDDAFAWSLRQRHLSRFPDAVLSSLRRLDTEQAWSFRERWLDAVGDAVDSTYEAAKVAAQCVGGLDDERAWAIRKRARAAAPVNAIASIKGLESDRSWRWRRRYLARAPKTVMQTLAVMDRPEAWSLRRQVADTCKEALDGMRGMDVPDAWQLREAHRDTWPSTVAKSLGRLADEARGRQLLERQLLHYPADLSLLQHAAAVALGVHTDWPEQD